MKMKELVKKNFEEELTKIFDETHDKVLTLGDETYRCMEECKGTDSDYSDLEDVLRKICIDFIINKIL